MTGIVVTGEKEISRSQIFAVQFNVKVNNTKCFGSFSVIVEYGLP